MTSNIRIVYTADPRFLNSIHEVAEIKGRKQANFNLWMNAFAQAAFNDGRRFQAQHPTLEAPTELPETHPDADEPVPDGNDEPVPT